MTMIIPPSDSSTPKTWQRKITVIPSKIEVPFMHMVEPSGSTKPAILGGTPSPSSAAWRAAGRVALLELVEKAVISAERTREKNSRGRSR